MIPNHTVSWAIYQQLGGPANVEARFYKFDNKQPSSNLYVQITIPKIDKYINFTPSLALIGPTLKNINNDQMKEFSEKNTVNKSSFIIDNNIINKDKIPFDIPTGYQLIINSPYKGPIPSPIFYEPFTQTSYWERQEIKTKLKLTGNEKKDIEKVPFIEMVAAPRN